MSDESCAPVLRQLRDRAGLTQDELACRAELSVRTVRAMERGAATPRAGSVIRLADALGLAGGDRRSFLEVWGIDQNRAPLPPDRLWGSGVGHLPIPRLVLDHYDDVHTVSAVVAARVSADGYVRALRADKIIEADRHGVDTVIAGASGRRPTSPRPRFVDVDGAVVRRTELPPHSSWAIVELTLPTRLRRGGRYSLALTAEFDEDKPRSPTVDDEHGMPVVFGLGFSRGARLCVLRATFAAGRGDCVYVVREHFDGPELLRRPLDASSGTTQMIIESPVSGWHGLTWGSA